MADTTTKTGFKKVGSTGGSLGIVQPPKPDDDKAKAKTK